MKEGPGSSLILGPAKGSLVVRQRGVANQADSRSGQSGHGDVFLGELDRILSALKREIRAHSTEIHNDELPLRRG